MSRLGVSIVIVMLGIGVSGFFHPLAAKPKPFASGKIAGSSCPDGRQWLTGTVYAARLMGLRRQPIHHAKIVLNLEDLGMAHEVQSDERGNYTLCGRKRLLQRVRANVRIWAYGYITSRIEVLIPGQTDFYLEADVDTDRDGLFDSADNCPERTNSDQRDMDRDGIGDVCDPDRDGDSVADATDNCPEQTNPEQVDGDGDGLGLGCDSDDTVYNCPADFIVSGTVSRPAATGGGPLAEAQVLLKSIDRADVLLVETTGNDGAFRFCTHRRFERGEHASVLAVAGAYSLSYYPSGLRIGDARASHADIAMMACPDSSRYFGIVTDAAENPLQARVRFENLSGVEGKSVMTDPSGAYSICMPPPSLWSDYINMRVLVTREGYYRERLEDRKGAMARENNFILRPRAQPCPQFQIVGELVSRDLQTPIGNATLRVLKTFGDGIRVPTSESGQFGMCLYESASAARPVLLVASAPGYKDLARGVTFGEDASVSVRLEMIPEGGTETALPTGWGQVSGHVCVDPGETPTFPGALSCDSRAGSAALSGMPVELFLWRVTGSPLRMGADVSGPDGSYAIPFEPVSLGPSDRYVVKTSLRTLDGGAYLLRNRSFTDSSDLTGFDLVVRNFESLHRLATEYRIEIVAAVRPHHFLLDAHHGSVDILEHPEAGYGLFALPLSRFATAMSAIDAAVFRMLGRIKVMMYYSESANPAYAIAGSGADALGPYVSIYVYAYWIEPEWYIHEIGHAVQDLIRGYSQGDRAALFENARSIDRIVFGFDREWQCPRGDTHPVGFISGYACYNEFEDFAETFRYFVSRGPSVRQWLGMTLSDLAPAGLALDPDNPASVIVTSPPAVAVADEALLKKYLFMKMLFGRQFEREDAELRNSLPLPP